MIYFAYFTMSIFIKRIHCFLYYLGAQYLLNVFTEPDLSTLIYIGQCLLYYVGAQYLLSVFTEPDYLPWFTLVNAYFTM